MLEFKSSLFVADAFRPGLDTTRLLETKKMHHELRHENMMNEILQQIARTLTTTPLQAAANKTHTNPLQRNPQLHHTTQLKSSTSA
jgi:NADPH-dependent 7-cyano-7-deazaguanine reductase QueF